MRSLIAPNVKRIIKEKGLKHAHVADKAGYSKNQFSSMLNGRKVVTDADVLRIAKVLDVSINELFGKEGGKLKIGNKEYLEIVVTNTRGELLASITDDNIITESDCIVECVPVDS